MALQSVKQLKESITSSGGRFLAAYAIVAVLYGLLLILMHSWMGYSFLGEYTILLLPPLFYAAFKFDRRVRLAAGLICVCVTGCVLYAIVDIDDHSLYTVAIFMIISLVTTEMICRVKTRRDRAEAALREREERYRRIVETAREGIWAIDTKANTTYVNNRMAEMLGYTVEEMQGASLFDFMDEEWRSVAHSRFHRRKEGAGEQHDFRFLRKDGSGLWTIVSANPVFDEEGRFEGALAMITDLSERKQAQEALWQKGEELRLVTENVPGLLSYLDKNGVYRFANKHYEEWFNVSQTEIIGKHYREVLGEAAYEQIKDRVETALSGRRVTFEESLPYAYGGVRWVIVDYVPDIDERGKTQGFFALVTDITERKHNEEALVKSRTELRALAAHLQSVREEEQALLARELHDELGHMLTGLKMDVASLGRNLTGEKEVSALRTRVASLSHDIDAVVQTLRRISCNLRPGLLDDLGIVAALEWQAGEFEKRTGIQCEFDLTEPSTVTDDQSTAVYRICQEALTNVARHANATNVRVRLAESDGILSLEVHDNGQGIIDSEISDPGSLGLLGIRERVYALGGEFHIQGTPGQGTHLTVRIPLREGCDRRTADNEDTHR